MSREISGNKKDLGSLATPEVLGLVFNFSNEMQKGGSVLRTEAANFFSKKMLISRFFYSFSNVGVLVPISSFAPKMKNVIRCNINKQLIKRFSLNFSYFLDSFIFVFRKSNLCPFVRILLCQVKKSLTLNLVSYNILNVDTNLSAFLKGGQQ